MQMTVEFPPAKKTFATDQDAFISCVSGIDLGVVKAALYLAFEAGKWVGQVELEEHYDREQYSSGIIEVLHARKHAMPITDASNGRTVTVNLRSDQWRAGVRKSADEYLKAAFDFVGDHYR